MTATVPVEPVEATAPPPAVPSWFERLSDRLNPILVREVQQAVKGRAFFLAVLAALMVSVGIALVVASDAYVTPNDGRDVFNVGLACLVPLVMFIVPMQAYQAMRMELRAGIVEQLLLSRLGPWRIVLGKLGTAMVQFFLYLAVLAPVLSLTYLLRGVDLPTIGWSLVFSLVFCLGATACAVSAAAQGVIPALQPLANLAIAFGLGMGSIGLMAFVGDGEYVRALGWAMRSSDWVLVVTSIVGGVACGIVLSSMIAASLLMHGFENRSTPFRLFQLAMVPIVFGWLWAFAPPAGWREVAPGVAIMLTLFGAVFGIFMVTETERLSPRARALAPRSAVLGFLVAALLPGRDRGLLFQLTFFALVGAISWVVWLQTPATTARWISEMWTAHLFIVGYTVIYLCLGRFVRTLLPETPMGTNLGRIAIPILLLVFCVGPVVFDALVQGRVRDWHPGHALDPFFTIGRFVGRNRGDDVMYAILVAAGAMALVSLPAMLRGVAEAATARRRALAAAEAAAASRAPEAPGAA